VITETDDFFCHQTIQPHAYVALNDLSWGERAYHTLSDPDRFGLDIGVATYPNRGMFHAYAIAAVPGRQWSLRATRDYSQGRWELRAGPIEAKIVEPMRRWTYTCRSNESGIAFDLEFEARNGPYMIKQPPIRKGGRLIHEDVYVFQTGFYSGTVSLDGTMFDVDRVPGARDRTWGIRVAGEGQLPQGVLAWLNANFDDVSIIAHIRDRGDEVPQVRDGAVYHDGGDIVPIVGFEHDLRFDFETRQCEGGTIVLTDAHGEVWPIEIDPALRIYLSGGGYTSTNTRRDRFTEPMWHERWDLTDPNLVARVEGLNDNVSHMRCNGRIGHGVLETSIGEHSRYKVREPVEWA
jgi:hypothetical protein